MYPDLPCKALTHWHLNTNNAPYRCPGGSLFIPIFRRPETFDIIASAVD